MIGSRRNDSSTIRATPSASGDERRRRNFSISSSARSEEGTLPGMESFTGVEFDELTGAAMATPTESGVLVSKSSSGTPRAREILLKVPAWGLLVLPRSI